MARLSAVQSSTTSNSFGDLLGIYMSWGAGGSVWWQDGSGASTRYLDFAHSELRESAFPR